MAEIYLLKHPVSAEIRYVGKANNSQARLKSHLRDAKRRNTPLYSWIRKLMSQGLIPTVEVVKVVDDSDWEAEESCEISKRLKEGCRLLNLAPGGNQPHPSPEQRAKSALLAVKSRHSTPQKVRVWNAKRQFAQMFSSLLKDHKSDKEKLRAIAEKVKVAISKRPDLFYGLSYLVKGF